MKHRIGRKIRMRNPPLGLSVELPMDPYGATKMLHSAQGPDLLWSSTEHRMGRKSRMRSPALGPSVELPMGPRSAVSSARAASEFWDLRTF
eukprot:3576488-Pyramimonas_sp.AAC.1